MNISYIMIHCEDHLERQDVIHETSQILQQPIQLFKGYHPMNMDSKEQLNYLQSIDGNLHFLNDFRFELSGQMGCYLSHHMLIKHIKENNHSDVSVIFEDDVKIPSTLHSDIINVVDILNSHDHWHFVFLGSLLDHRHTHVANNIYYMDSKTYCWGTHAMLINNKHIHEIYDALCGIELNIDSRYTVLSHQKTLNGYTIYPSICFQSNLKSSINI